MTDLERQRSLRRMKVVATGMLVAAAAVYVVARANQDQGTWIGYVRAFAEAAMVGALADWFAVTALFRYPLGIPIPHTAIIPRRKDQIGRSLGEFVEGNFLTGEILGERVAQAEVGRRLGVWLSEPANAERAAEAMADALRGALEVLDDSEVQAGLERVVESRVRATPVAPLVGRAIDLAVEDGHHERLLDSALLSIHGFLEENRTVLRSQLEKESPWWIPEPLDDRIFAKIYSAVDRFLSEVGGHPEHEVRHNIRRRVLAFAERLRTDPELLTRGEALKEELLDHADVRAWLASLWGEAKWGLLHAAGDPNSELRRRMAGALRRFGQRLMVDPALQHKVDGWVESGARYLVEHYRSEVSDLIASTVERWDTESTARKLELQVGRDLQFIRINGTLVGGLAGLAIHTASELLF